MRVARPPFNTEGADTGNERYGMSFTARLTLSSNDDKKEEPEYSFIHSDYTHCCKQVDSDLRTMLIKPTAERPQMIGVRVWPQAIPQFNIGHLDTVDVSSTSLN